ncbi:MAG: GTPase Era [Christensenellales bacterium]|jgi:GTP-binding protein Era
MEQSFRSGFVALAGRPNVGKSTLMNALVGEKVSIVSSKPQTTRNQIRGILTRDGVQVVFIDTPGMHKPRNELGEYMVRAAVGAWRDVDLILAVLDASEPIGEGDERLIGQVGALSTPAILALNKIDRIRKEELLALIDRFAALQFIAQIIPVSALTGDGVPLLEREIVSRMPEGPRYFPDDIYTDQPERMLAAELIREKALMLLREEIPHGIGVEIFDMGRREEQELVDIHANILCEKASHKSIIIGKGGRILGKIGQLARRELEALLGDRINLQLWVKVRPDWRNSVSWMRELGYDSRDLQ